MASTTSEQRIIRGKHKSHFAILPNALLEHGKLSVEAKGLMAYLLSRPPNWHIRPKQLCVRLRIGRDRLYRMLSECIEAGYVERRQARKRGAFTPVSYFVNDVASLPQTDLPDPAQPDAAQPDTANQDAIIRKNVIKKKDEKETASARSLSPRDPAECAAQPAWPGKGSKPPYNPSAAQARLAERFGLGNAEQGWLILGALTEAELSRLTASEIAGTLDMRQIRESALLARARAVAAELDGDRG